MIAGAETTQSAAKTQKKLLALQVNYERKNALACLLACSRARACLRACVCAPPPLPPPSLPTRPL
jgi:hypothetical protein